MNYRGARLTGAACIGWWRATCGVQRALRHQPARAAALVRHAPARARRGPARHPGAARPRRADHHPALHAGQVQRTCSTCTARRTRGANTPLADLPQACQTTSSVRAKTRWTCKPSQGCYGLHPSESACALLRGLASTAFYASRHRAGTACATTSSSSHGSSQRRARPVARGREEYRRREPSSTSAADAGHGNEVPSTARDRSRTRLRRISSSDQRWLTGQRCVRPLRVTSWLGDATERRPIASSSERCAGSFESAPSLEAVYGICAYGRPVAERAICRSRGSRQRRRFDRRRAAALAAAAADLDPSARRADDAQQPLAVRRTHRGVRDVSSGCIGVRSRCEMAGHEPSRGARAVARRSADALDHGRRTGAVAQQPRTRPSSLTAISAMIRGRENSQSTPDSAATRHRVPPRRAAAAPRAGLAGSRCRAS